MNNILLYFMELQLEMWSDSLTLVWRWVLGNPGVIIHQKQRDCIDSFIWNCWKSQFKNIASFYYRDFQLSMGSCPNGNSVKRAPQKCYIRRHLRKTNNHSTLSALTSTVKHVSSQFVLGVNCCTNRHHCKLSIITSTTM